MVQLHPLEHPVTCTLVVVMILLFLGTLLSPAVLQATALVWNKTFTQQFYIWNLFTHSLIETNFLKLLVSITGIVRFGPLVETQLSSIWFSAYMLIVCLACGIITSVAVFVLYVITRYEYLLSIEMHGAWGLVSALAVGAAQALPSQPLIPAVGIAGFKIRHLPMSMVLLSGLLYGIGLRSFSKDFPFVCIGTYVSWMYLRFFHCYTNTTASTPAAAVAQSVGDLSREFQFIMFCPPVTRRLLKPCADFAYGVAQLLGLFKGRKDREALALAAQQQQQRGGRTGGFEGEGGISTRIEVRDPVAERRRARAMKLLDEKFAKLSAAEAHKWDDEEAGQAATLHVPAHSNSPVKQAATPAVRASAASNVTSNDSLTVKSSSSSSSSAPSSSTGARKGASSAPVVMAGDDDDWEIDKS